MPFHSFFAEQTKRNQDRSNKIFVTNRAVALDLNHWNIKIDMTSLYVSVSICLFFFLSFSLSVSLSVSLLLSLSLSLSVYLSCRRCARKQVV